MWQEVREELHPGGFELVTVALETRGLSEAARWIEAAAPKHPSLIDQAHLLDELYGVVNVPTGIWIDEAGVIVRPAEAAWPGVARFTEAPGPGEEAPTPLRVIASGVLGIHIQPRRYLEALREWVASGAHALAPAEVIARSGERSREAALAAAHFELGQHLHRTGREKAAQPHFREAHRLKPDNWTYKRQAWAMVDRLQGPNDVYDGDWITDVNRQGPENYYRNPDF